MPIDNVRKQCYNTYIRKAKQPGKSKTPDTESNIPVSEQTSKTNSQEDSFGVVPELLEIERRQKA